MNVEGVRALIAGADPAELERLGWQALATSGAAAARFYTEVLDDGATMLLPGGMALTDRETMLQAMSGQPWSRYRLEDLRASPVTDDVVAVTYGVVAERTGSPPYSALMSSVYAHRPNGWKLALHQQTPR
jgi:hypothetical protein